jgi:hypothetical protein
VILSTFITAVLVLASPTAAVAAEPTSSVAPTSVIQDDSDSDSDNDRQRGRGDIFGRGRNGNSDSDSDSDSDGDWDGRNGSNRRGDNCIDINRDGRCDFGSGRRVDNRRSDDRRGDDRRSDRGRFPIDNRRIDRGRFPDMISAVMASRGQRSSADQWLPRGIRNVRLLDRDRNRVPERATFLDGAGRIAQVWFDNNRDGRADRMQFYQAGRLVRVATR